MGCSIVLRLLSPESCLAGGWAEPITMGCLLDIREARPTGREVMHSPQVQVA